jgi:hypothetical protein
VPKISAKYAGMVAKPPPYILMMMEIQAMKSTMLLICPG